MTVYAVGNAAMIGAFELIGIAGRVPERGQDLGPLLTDLARDDGIRLLFVQADLAAGLPDELLDELLDRWRCLVRGVPGPGDPAPDLTPLLRRVQGVVGGAM